MASVETYIPQTMADDLRKLKMGPAVTAVIVQKALREAIAAKKSHIEWAEAGCPETPAKETPSLKELLNISHDEGTMSYLVTVEQSFNARTANEGVQQALVELRRVFGEDAHFKTSLLIVGTMNGTCIGKIEAKVYLL